MIEVRVDFNARGPQGLVKASLRRADGELQEGAKVLAVDADEDLSYVAVVHSIDQSSGRVWLEMHWDAAIPASVQIVTASPAFAFSGLTSVDMAGSRPLSRGFVHLDKHDDALTRIA